MIPIRRKTWSSAGPTGERSSRSIPRVAFADLVIGAGECMPHPCAGFGGGFKIFMPGVCSYRSVAEHHFTWMRHRKSRVNILDGNPWYEDIVDAGRIGRAFV